MRPQFTKRCNVDGMIYDQLQIGHALQGYVMMSGSEVGTFPQPA
jgi:hypothetical protein